MNSEFAQGSNDVVARAYTAQIRDLIYRASGIYHAEHRLGFLQERCTRRMKELNVSSVRNYYDMLMGHSTAGGELHKLLNEVTIGETSFFRSPAQLDALQRSVLPTIVENRKKLPLKHVRIWSAGCSTGEEAYTLAMICLQESQFGCLKGFTFEIIATDINERSLSHATAGLYSDYTLRNMPVDFRRKHMEAAGDQWRVSDDLKSVVRFSRVNLLDDARLLFIKAIDVVFCCNVLIYFDLNSKRRVIEHFYNNLLPNSYLFLGHSETLFGVSERFKLVHFPGAVAYVKPSSDVARVPK